MEYMAVYLINSPLNNGQSIRYCVRIYKGKT